jgi:hypothetical protein
MFISGPSPPVFDSNPQSDISAFESETGQYPIKSKTDKYSIKEYGMSKIRSDSNRLHP